MEDPKILAAAVFRLIRTSQLCFNTIVSLKAHLMNMGIVDVLTNLSVGKYQSKAQSHCIALCSYVRHRLFFSRCSFIALPVFGLLKQLLPKQIFPQRNSAMEFSSSKSKYKTFLCVFYEHSRIIILDENWKGWDKEGSQLTWTDSQNSKVHIVWQLSLQMYIDASW